MGASDNPGAVHDAEKAFNRFLAKYRPKCDKAADCLAKDREALLAFHDIPTEHWKHIRTGSPIESTFATVRHRTTRSKGALDQHYLTLRNEMQRSLEAIGLAA